jgi:pimeloyl-ACP methyl ester carboxylesterase
MKRLLKILAWTLGIIIVLLAGIVIHANYRIGKDEVLALDAQAPGRFITIDGRRQHFVVHGELAADLTGAPLMIIHGFIVSGHESLMPWAVDKLEGRALILPDLMGYGYSERDTTPGDWSTPKSHARYLAAMLDHLGVPKVDIVGHSYGSAIAARFALDYPQRVRRIVFISPGLYLERSSTEVVIQMPVVGRALAWHMISGGPYSFVGRRCRGTPDCPSMRPAHIRDTTDTLRAMMYTSRHTTVLEDLYAEIPHLTAPSLVLWGEKDWLVPRAIAERLARDTHAKLVVIPDSWHMPFLDHPDDVALRVLDFFGPDGHVENAAPSMKDGAGSVK